MGTAPNAPSGSGSDSGRGGGDTFDAKLSKRSQQASGAKAPSDAALPTGADAPDPSSQAGVQRETAPAVPVGVVLLEVGQTPNWEVLRLTRPRRYFDDDFTPLVQSAISCWRCGRRGHMARDCVKGSNDRPCHMCAQYGHEARECPHRLCFRCGLPGHVLEACTNQPATEGGVCVRCGLASCPLSGKGDQQRYAQGCTMDYHPQDTRSVRCMSCGQKGHLCCAAVPADVPPATCCNCGGRHIADDCDQPMQTHLAAEQRGDEYRARVRRQQQHHQQREVRRGPPPTTYNTYSGGYGHQQQGGGYAARVAHMAQASQGYGGQGHVNAYGHQVPQYGGGYQQPQHYSQHQQQHYGEQQQQGGHRNKRPRY